MSDSLRDQLLKAGFAEVEAKKKPKPRSRHKPNSRPNSRSDSGPDSSSKSGSATRHTAKEHAGKLLNQPSDAASHAGNNPSSSAPASNQPKAGYTHVAPPVAKKKKKKQKAPAIKPRAGSWSTREPAAVADKPRVANTEQVQQRRQMKAEIQSLIDTNALKQYTGEAIYRFTLQNKIRELLVSDTVRKQLVSGELAITRLNGATRIIPQATAASIRDINPQWLMFISTDVASASEDDDDFPIPDDLIW